MFWLSDVLRLISMTIDQAIRCAGSATTTASKIAGVPVGFLENTVGGLALTVGKNNISDSQESLVETCTVRCSNAAIAWFPNSHPNHGYENSRSDADESYGEIFSICLPHRSLRQSYKVLTSD